METHIYVFFFLIVVPTKGILNQHVLNILYTNAEHFSPLSNRSRRLPFPYSSANIFADVRARRCSAMTDA